ncbi:MAG: hypothetical protein Q9196_004277 [Gyalolechia fulgens]
MPPLLLRPRKPHRAPRAERMPLRPPMRLQRLPGAKPPPAQRARERRGGGMQRLDVLVAVLAGAEEAVVDAHGAAEGAAAVRAFVRFELRQGALVGAAGGAGVGGVVGPAVPLGFLVVVERVGGFEGLVAGGAGGHGCGRVLKGLKRTLRDRGRIGRVWEW